MARVTGAPEVSAGLRQAGLRVRRAMVAGTEDAGKHVLGEARDNAPYDKGALNRSGRLHDAQVDQRGVSVEVSFGGPSTPHNVDYAAIVHERRADYVVGGPGFLRRAVERGRREDWLTDAVGNAVRRELERS